MPGCKVGYKHKFPKANKDDNIHEKRSTNNKENDLNGRYSEVINKEYIKKSFTNVFICFKFYIFVALLKDLINYILDTLEQHPKKIRIFHCVTD